MSEWRPMDTAPRDGTRIIGWFGDRPIVVWWRSGPGHGNNYAGGIVWYWSSGYNRHPEPEFWQPTPDGPAGYVAASTAVTLKPKPRKAIPHVVPVKHVITIAEKPKVKEDKQPKFYEFPREWCDQCQRRMTRDEAKFCASIFCKAKVSA